MHVFMLVSLNGILRVKKNQRLKLLSSVPRRKSMFSKQNKTVTTHFKICVSTSKYLFLKIPEIYLALYLSINFKKAEQPNGSLQTDISHQASRQVAKIIKVKNKTYNLSDIAQSSLNPKCMVTSKTNCLKGFVTDFNRFLNSQNIHLSDLC